jgi:signal peptide peptidase SppA
MHDTTRFAAYDPLFGTAPMAMDPTALADLLARAERTIDRFLAIPTADAMAAYESARAARTLNAEVRGKVGILKVEGSLLKRDTWISRALGCTTYEALMRDFAALMDNRDVAAIALYVDTPGGEANGCSALADAIYAARSKKPVTAYVSGMACSAGYWIASAADRVVTSSLGTIGSIGIAMTMSDYSKRDEARGVRRVEFVSSQSPGKRPDIHTDAGRARVQKLVDDLGAVFVKAVAKHRGVSTDTVIKKFGAGGVEIGAKAVAKGMADEVGQFDDVVKRLQPGAPRSVASASAVAATPVARVAASPTPAERAAQAKAADSAAKLEAERQKAQTDASWKSVIDRANANGAPGAVSDPTADDPWRKHLK